MRPRARLKTMDFEHEFRSDESLSDMRGIGLSIRKVALDTSISRMMSIGMENR